MFKVRENEPDYAFVPNVESPETNCYGKPIKLVEGNDPLAGKSLNINGDSGVGDNPNRYKQHGFYFNADNCIACHACEAACAEKNDTPAHLAFRSVGYLEGGSYPAVKRLNISMACNHCDDPVCLKGCPTLAYTKYAEYGAVLQDPDICFGCGYCTWVCPYNAPQLDPVAGHVSKCNMCVDRLEVGLKPACVSACLGAALDFGVIETTPDNRDQLATSIPGFPDTSITNPNIRFQQTRSLPREMKRTDSTPIQYVRDDQNAKPDPGVKGGQGQYRSAPLPRSNKPMQWSLEKLRSREDPLVIFTLITQAVVGAFLLLFLGPQFGLEMLSAFAHPIAYPITLFGLIAAQTFALVISTLHLGRPHRFYRAFNNLRHSPVSREVAAVAVFYTLLGAYAALTGLPQLFSWLPEGLVSSVRELSGWLAVIAGPASIYFMQRIYRIPARPFWNHWQVMSSFYASLLTLGSLVVALVFVPLLVVQGSDYSSLLASLSVLILAGLTLEAFGLFRHADYLRHHAGEGQAAWLEQTTSFGKTYWLRNALMSGAAALILIAALSGISGAIGFALWSLAAAALLAAALIGRALFYVLVIPTTMPGAFFWKNPAFQDHARHSGLANMPQVGVQ
ncbi:Anaerobic dimethyl sulfoxide reductase chain B, iron-sulfur binding subunit [hydrothermal vent metagenome]|uniref:Anaerobic dimethyl sulfoxide reductase chain B, iron-sulfur binding subunit n=1 Tax=hydrothermal vent metagenome TaxID=652676 RepID=A0A3B0Y467_9ZZZZ